MAERADFVPIVGAIHLHTSLGTFLDVGERRIFDPQIYASTFLRRSAPSERLVVQLLGASARKKS
jgi:hypothetical protein